MFPIIQGEITTREPLDRETRSVHELVLEARDQGTPSRAARVPLKVTVLDVNDNSPQIVDPQGDVVSVREEQPSGTEVARVRALDTDLGENASVTYSILTGKRTLSAQGCSPVNIIMCNFYFFSLPSSLNYRRSSRATRAENCLLLTNDHC